MRAEPSPGQALSAMGMATLLALSISHGSFAAGGECGSAASQAEMTRCFGDRAKAASAALGSALSQYRARLAGDQLKLFDSSQSAWETYRDLDCRFQASGVKGGSAYSMILSQCLETRARRRIADIRQLAACEEGDLSCPAWK